MGASFLKSAFKMRIQCMLIIFVKLPSRPHVTAAHPSLESRGQERAPARAGRLCLVNEPPVTSIEATDVRLSTLFAVVSLCLLMPLSSLCLLPYHFIVRESEA